MIVSISVGIVCGIGIIGAIGILSKVTVWTTDQIVKVFKIEKEIIDFVMFKYKRGKYQKVVKPSINKAYEPEMKNNPFDKGE